MTPPPISILIINPNSTPSVTTALAHPSVAYGPLTTPTGPPPSPCSRPHPQHHPHPLTPPLLPAPTPSSPPTTARTRTHKPVLGIFEANLASSPLLRPHHPTPPQQKRKMHAPASKSSRQARRGAGGVCWAAGCEISWARRARGSRAWRRRTWQRWSCMQGWRRRWCGRVREAAVRLLRKGEGKGCLFGVCGDV